MGVLSTLVVSPDAKSRGGRRIDALGKRRGRPLRPPCRDPDRPLAAGPGRSPGMRCRRTCARDPCTTGRWSGGRISKAATTGRSATSARGG